MNMLRGVGAAREPKRVRDARIRFDDVDHAQQHLIEGLKRGILIGHAPRP